MLETRVREKEPRTQLLGPQRSYSILPVPTTRQLAAVRYKTTRPTTTRLPELAHFWATPPATPTWPTECARSLAIRPVRPTRPPALKHSEATPLAAPTPL